MILLILACGPPSMVECEPFRTGCAERTQELESCCPYTLEGQRTDEPCYYHAVETLEDFTCLSADNCDAATGDALCAVCIYPNYDMWDWYCGDADDGNLPY